jgi:hypothetical protein
MALTLAELDEIRERVARKGWLNVVHHPDDGQLVERIVSSSALLNGEQRDLFGKLIDAYLYIPEIRNEVFDLWVKIRSFCSDYDRVYIVPLKKKGERRTKSGDQISYVLSSLISQNDSKYKSFGTPFSNEIVDQQNFCAVFIDDFVGTGETVEECVEEFRKKHPEMNTVVASIVAQERGIAAAERLGVQVLANHRRDRVISDGNSIDGSTSDNLRVYNSIEGAIGVSHDYRLGYGASEAVVTISRTPDNTLPIFWINSPDEDFAWLAPFPRR